VGQQWEEQSGSRQIVSRIVQLERYSSGSQGHRGMGTEDLLPFCGMSDMSNLPAGFYHQ